MKIPLAANIEFADNIQEIKGEYIKNPYAGKDMLTVEEALDSINKISGMLLADNKYKKVMPQGKKKYGTQGIG